MTLKFEFLACITINSVCLWINLRIWQHHNVFHILGLTSIDQTPIPITELSVFHHWARRRIDESKVHSANSLLEAQWAHTQEEMQLVSDIYKVSLDRLEVTFDLI